MHRQAQHFYPRPPRGGRLDRLHRAVNNMAFLSTPSARRATASAAAFLSTTDHFYPRPPRGGRPPAPTSQTRWVKRFLSTPSARRATRGRPEGFSPENYFYPRPPRGGRLSYLNNMPAGLYFYPRPPRGGRPAAALNAAESLAFLSTPSARRATPFDGLYPISRGISIHALREEGDTTSISIKANEMYFYPRPPRGGRPRSKGGTL